MHTICWCCFHIGFRLSGRASFASSLLHPRCQAGAFQGMQRRSGLLVLAGVASESDRPRRLWRPPIGRPPTPAGATRGQSTSRPFFRRTGPRDSGRPPRSRDHWVAGLRGAWAGSPPSPGLRGRAVAGSWWGFGAGARLWPPDELFWSCSSDRGRTGLGRPSSNVGKPSTFHGRSPTDGGRDSRRVRHAPCRTPPFRPHDESRRNGRPKEGGEGMVNGGSSLTAVARESSSRGSGGNQETGPIGVPGGPTRRLGTPRRQGRTSANIGTSCLC